MYSNIIGGGGGGRGEKVRREGDYCEPLVVVGTEAYCTVRPGLFYKVSLGTSADFEKSVL